MKRLSTHGFFVTFEGGEGAGKGSVIAALGKRLREAGGDPLLTREPGGSEECARIRALLVERASFEWTPQAELLLMMADRAQHVARVIRPALEAGRLVLCDRYGASSRAYQGAGHGIDAVWIAALQVRATDALAPDLSVLIDVAPEVGLARSLRRLSETGSGESRFEQHDLGFHSRVRESFLEQARADSGRWFVVDGSQPLEAVIAAVAAEVERRLARAGGG